MSHLTRLFNPCSVASIVAVGFLISPHHALAIAPSQQQTNPAAGTTLNSVVRMVANATTGVGTGSIIDTSLGGFGSGYFFVLTADHNFPSATGISFGTNLGGPFNPVYNVVNVARGGASGNEDIALAAVLYGTPNAFFNNVDPLGLWNPQGNNGDALTSYVMSSVASFTEIGDGISATPHYNVGGTQDGWTPQARATANFGVQRFQNNFPTGAIAGDAANDFPYVNNSVDWHPHNPSAPNTGEGTSFAGDSGGPYLLEDPTTSVISGLSDPNNQGGTLPNQTIQYYTDTIFAVHDFGDNANPALYSDAMDNGGDILSAADITWIQQNEISLIPEPATGALILAVSAFAMLRRHRARAI